MSAVQGFVKTKAASSPSPRALVRRLARRSPLLRSRDLEARGVSREMIRLMVEQGELHALSKGVYALSDTELSAQFSLAIVAKRVPDGVVCLLSALLFHEIGTQLPHQVWVGVGFKAHQPQLDYPPLRVFRFSPLSLHEGVESHRIDGEAVAITSPARTLVDCFRYRNKIGLDVALEALKDCFRARAPRDGKGREKPLVTYAQVEALARQFRVANVMRPYLETVAAE